MEDAKSNCGIPQSTNFTVSHTKGSQSSPSPGTQVKLSNPSTPCQGPFAHRPLTMAPQQSTLKGGQSHSSHQHGTWAGTSVWEHAPSIADTIEGAPSEYGGGRPMEWDVKGSPWEWESMGIVYPGRRGTEPHASKSPLTDNGAMGTPPAISPAGNNGSSFPKIGGENPPPDAGKVGNLGGLDYRPPSQGSDSAVSIEQQRRLFLGLGETGSGSAERRKNDEQGQGHAEASKVGGVDSLIGLKLGRRTYFEDSGGGGRGGGAVFAVCPPGKKQRVQSAGMQTPRCQVEGCKQDLSGSKDYHRRHKVCETHSKAAKVIAAGFEQRFCQQCSRFHVLTEFDEGKRSCRRRLAGHNERRRKPQPESAAIVSTGSSAVFHSECGSHATSVTGEEDKRGTSGLTERACFMPIQRTPGSSSTSVEDSDDQSGSLGTNFKLNQGKGPWPVLGRAVDSSGLTCQLQVACGERQPFLSSSTADRLLMLLQSPKGQIAGAGVHEFMLEGSGPVGPGLTLASSSGPASVLSALEAPTSPSVSGISDSGRALSLLSSQAWGSRAGASGSVSLDVSAQSDVTLEQLISENSRSPFSSRGAPSHFHASGAGLGEKLFRRQPHSPRDLGLSTISRVDSREQRGFLSGLSMVGSFESHTMLAVMQGQSEFRAMQGSASATQRPTIDLMQLPSPQSHGQFSEFAALRPFESSLFDSQQML